MRQLLLPLEEFEVLAFEDAMAGRDPARERFRAEIFEATVHAMRRGQNAQIGRYVQLPLPGMGPDMTNWDYFVGAMYGK